MNTSSPFSIYHLLMVDSTQDEAWRRVQAGATSGIVVVADVQTKGRGRQGRVWETPVGNLAATLVWQFKPGTERAEDFSLIVAVAMHRAISLYLYDPQILQLKWPNDLMIRGKKCAGILIESPEPGWVLIGTGVNLSYAPEDRAKINDHVVEAVTPDQLLQTYLEYFIEALETYRLYGLISLVASWREYAYGLGDPMTVRLQNEDFTAVFRGLDDDGAALAELPDGRIRRLRSGEVIF